MSAYKSKSLVSVFFFIQTVPMAQNWTQIDFGLLSWNVNDCLVDLEKELSIITKQALEGEEAKYGERLIQFASENLVTEILIHPAVSTLSQCVRNLLSSFTRHRHIIHAGYTFQGNGSWALQDGTFSYADFTEAFQEIEVQRVIHAYENGISIDLHCSPEGDWTRLPKETFTRSCKVRVNPTDVLTTGSPSISNFIKYLAPFLVPTSLDNILESSDVVGNIRFSRPTLYVFPGGQGDAALFGINGFNMLLDGGYSRKACYWDFVRHLDRLDAVLMTRLNNSSVCGISSVLKRKREGAVYPQVGHFFCNIQERKSLLSPDGDKDRDPLIFSILEEGQSIVQDLQYLSINPQPCYRDSEPIILYHKVGHGTLNMYVLSPDKNSREVREFLQKWNQTDPKMFASSRGGRDFSFPLQNMVSICALLLWQPANPNDTITRILYPGSTPQKKIFEGLDRLKSLEYIKHPVCSEKSITPVKKTKQDVIEKMITREKAMGDKRTENKLIEDAIKNGDMNGDVVREKQVKKSDSLESDKEKKVKKMEDSKKVEEGKRVEKIEDAVKVVQNGEKAKPKAKPTDAKPAKKRSDSHQRKKASSEKKGPPTPKKTIENKTVDETKEKEKERRGPQKPSPSATPAKSTKDANNRRVIENKKAPPKKETPPKAVPAAEAKAKPERKPISRRPKAVKGPPSPMKKITNGVQKPDSLSKRGKLDKEGTTDSSTVSTPSADQDSILKKDISKLTPEEIQKLKDKELDELKEEQDAIKEIEAVFRKGEGHVEEAEPGVRKIKEISIDDNLEAEEYLIIEKEEIEHDSLDQETKEDEMQKLVRDSEESEKPRKKSTEEREIKLEKDEKEEVPGKKASVPEEAPSKKDVSARALDQSESKKSQILSPEEKNTPLTDKKELIEEEAKEVVESQPEEKISANIESGATTTAPTLPEDERITLDEIKEDNGQPIEEKYVKEETKEKEVPIIQLPSQSQQDSQPKLPTNVGISLDKQKHMRDIVKTPDEVADLPVHEEADYHEFHGDAKKSNELDVAKDQVNNMDEKKEDKVDIDESKEHKKDSKKKEEESVKYESAEIEAEKCIVKKGEVKEHEIEENQKTKIHEDVVKAVKVDKTDEVIEKKERVIEEKNVKEDKQKLEKDLKEAETESQVFLQHEIIAEDLTKENMISPPKPTLPDTEKSSEITKDIFKETSSKTDDRQKFEILEKSELETKEKTEKDTIVYEDKLKERMDDEWVVISKDDEEEDEQEKIVGGAHDKDMKMKKEDLKEPETEKLAESITEYEVVKPEDLKQDLKITEDVQKNLHNDITDRDILEKTLPTEEVEKDTKKDETQKEVVDSQELSPREGTESAQEKYMESESEYDDHEIRKEDEIEEILEKEKEDIKALIEEADKKIITELKSDKAELTEVMKETEKIDHIKDTKQEVQAMNEKIQDLKKKVVIPVEEINVASTKSDLTAVEETIKIDLKDDVENIAKIDNKLQEPKKSAEDIPVKDEDVKIENSAKSLEHAEQIVLPDSSPEEDDLPIFKELDIDKSELGRKSPAEREEDVKKIVASVAEVLKSEAPLEEFKGKLPFTQELRETHITTQDSPLIEAKVIITDDIPPIPEEPALEEEPVEVKEKRRDLLAGAQELIAASSKVISDIKSKSEEKDLKQEEEDTTIEEKDDDPGTVHRMLVTASSEDGGEETEICPPGTIIFSKSSESSGRSSPEPSQKTQSQKSSIIETQSDTLSTIKQLTEKDLNSVMKDHKMEIDEVELISGETVVSTKSALDGVKVCIEETAEDIAKNNKQAKEETKSVVSDTPEVDGAINKNIKKSLQEEIEAMSEDDKTDLKLGREVEEKGESITKRVDTVTPGGVLAESIKKEVGEDVKEPRKEVEEDTQMLVHEEKVDSKFAAANDDQKELGNVKETTILDIKENLSNDMRPEIKEKAELQESTAKTKDELTKEAGDLKDRIEEDIKSMHGTITGQIEDSVSKTEDLSKNLASTFVGTEVEAEEVIEKSEEVTATAMEKVDDLIEKAKNLADQVGKGVIDTTSQVEKSIDSKVVEVCVGRFDSLEKESHDLKETTRKEILDAKESTSAKIEKVENRKEEPDKELKEELLQITDEAKKELEGTQKASDDLKAKADLATKDIKGVIGKDGEQFSKEFGMMAENVSAETKQLLSDLEQVEEKTVKFVSDIKNVAEDKAEGGVVDIQAKRKAIVETSRHEVRDIIDEVKQTDHLLEEAIQNTQVLVDEHTKKVGDVGEKVAVKVGESVDQAKSDISDRTHEITASVGDAAGMLKKGIEQKVEQLVEKATDMVQTSTEKAERKADIGEKMEDVFSNVTEKADEAISKAEKISGEVTDKIAHIDSQLKDNIQNDKDVTLRKGDDLVNEVDKVETKARDLFEEKARIVDEKISDLEGARDKQKEDAINVAEDLREKIEDEVNAKTVEAEMIISGTIKDLAEKDEHIAETVIDSEKKIKDEAESELSQTIEKTGELVSQITEVGMKAAKDSDAILGKCQDLTKVAEQETDETVDIVQDKLETREITTQEKNETVLDKTPDIKDDKMREQTLPQEEVKESIEEIRDNVMEKAEDVLKKTDNALSSVQGTIGDTAKSLLHDIPSATKETVTKHLSEFVTKNHTKNDGESATKDIAESVDALNKEDTFDQSGTVPENLKNTTSKLEVTEETKLGLEAIEQNGHLESSTTASRESTPDHSKDRKIEHFESYDGKASAKIALPVDQSTPDILKDELTRETEHPQEACLKSELSPAKKVSSEVLEKNGLESSPVVSGKSSPDSQYWMQEKQQLQHDSSRDEEGSQEVLEKDGHLESSTLISGKSTPDLLNKKHDTEQPKHDDSKHEKVNHEVLKENGQLEYSPVISGKSTPDSQKDIRDDPKLDAFKDEKSGHKGLEEYSDLESSSAIAGKSTSDSQEDKHDLEHAMKKIDEKSGHEVMKHSHLESSLVISGKSTPDSQEDKHDLENAKPDASIDAKSGQEVMKHSHLESSLVISGKSTPDSQEDKHDLENAKPDASMDAKSGHEVMKHSHLESSLVISGKSTPDSQEDKHDLENAKPDASMDAKSGHEVMKHSHLESSLVISGKSTPESQEDKHDIEHTKLDASIDKKSGHEVMKHSHLETSLVISGKSTPDSQVDKHDLEHAKLDASIDAKSGHEVMKHSHLESSLVISGKSTPESQEDKHGIERAKLDASIDAKSGHEVMKHSHLESSLVISGKSTPESQEDKHDLEHAKLDASIDAKSGHEVMKHSHLESSLVISGKSTPDSQVDKHDLEHAKLDASIDGKSGHEVMKHSHLESSLVISGKSTPESQEDKHDLKHTKLDASIDEKSGHEVIKHSHLESSLGISGKSTPDSQVDKHDLENAKPDASIDEKSGHEVIKHSHLESSLVISGKSTPESQEDKHDLKHTKLDASIDEKSGHEVIKHSHLESSLGISGKSTPDSQVDKHDLEHAKFDASIDAKSGHEVMKHSHLESSLVISGKSTPESQEDKHDLEHTKLDASIDEKSGHEVIKHSHLESSLVISGKSTPESQEDKHDLEHTKLDASIDEKSGHEAIKHSHLESSLVISGKSTPDSQVDKHDLEHAKLDASIDAKSGHEVMKHSHLESSLVISGKSTPESQEDKHDLEHTKLDASIDEKSGHEVIKHSHLESSLVISGKSTPDSQVDKHDLEHAKLDASIDTKSGHEVMKHSHLESSLIISGKSTPDSQKDKHDIEHAKLDASIDETSGHEVLEKPTHLESSSVVSGKSTSDLQKDKLNEEQPKQDKVTNDVLEKGGHKEVSALDSGRASLDISKDHTKDEKHAVDQSEVSPDGKLGSVFTNKYQHQTPYLDKPTEESSISKGSKILDKPVSKEPKDDKISPEAMQVKKHLESFSVISEKPPHISKDVDRKEEKDEPLALSQLDKSSSEAVGPDDSQEHVTSDKSTVDISKEKTTTDKHQSEEIETKSERDGKATSGVMDIDSHLETSETLTGKYTPDIPEQRSDKVQPLDSNNKRASHKESHLEPTSPAVLDKLEDKLEKDLVKELDSCADSEIHFRTDVLEKKSTSSGESGESEVSKEMPQDRCKIPQEEYNSVISSISEKYFQEKIIESKEADPLKSSEKPESKLKKQDDDEGKFVDESVDHQAQTQRRGSVIEAAEEFIEKSEKVLGSILSAIGDAGKSVLHEMLPIDEDKSGESTERDKQLKQEKFESGTADTFKKEHLQKEEKELEDKNAQKSVNLETVSDLDEIDTKDVMKIKEMKADIIDGNAEDKTHTAKIEPSKEEKAVDKSRAKKEQKQLVDHAEAVSKSYDHLSKLTESVSFDKCKTTEDFKVDKDIIEKEEKFIDEEVDRIQKRQDSLTKLSESVSFDKCKPSDEFKIDEKVVKEEEKYMLDRISHLQQTIEEVTDLSKSISFDKCSTSKKAEENQSDALENVVERDVVKMDIKHDSHSSKQIIDSNKLQDIFAGKAETCEKKESMLEQQEKRDPEKEHPKVEDKPEDEAKEVKGTSETKEYAASYDQKADDSKSEAIQSVHIEQTASLTSHKLDDKISEPSKPGDNSVKDMDLVSEEQPISSQTEKCEKESMEKTLSEKDSRLKAETTESKKLSISDVEISIKTEHCPKEATRSFLDNERALMQDTTDAKIFIHPVTGYEKERVSQSQAGSSSVLGVTLETSTLSDKSSPDLELSGKTTPPTVPVSPIAKDKKSPISKLDSGLSEQTETDEEDLSTKSQVAHSQSDLDELDMKMDPMSMSIYGALPEEHLEHGGEVPATLLYEITKAKFTAELREEVVNDESKKGKTDLMTASFIGELPSGPSQSKPSEDREQASKGDTVDSWGKPLGLPAPTHLYEVTKAKFSAQSEETDLMTRSFIGQELPRSTRAQETADPMTTSVYFEQSSESTYDPIASWGKPLGLPSPAPPNNNEKGTPKKEKKLPAYVSAKNKLNDDRKRAESPSKLKAKKVNPVYVDLTYVPHHGNHNYCYVDFFKKVRARYYVFSGLEPSRQVYDALLEAKQTWEDKELEVTIIPTYDTDILGYWVAENEELLTKFKIDLSPSASRCTINLQDHETSCSAYRLEF